MTGVPRINFAHLNVLVVEDNSHTLKLLKGVLRAFGTRQLRACENGPEALDQLTTFFPDLVITDLAMRPMNGLQLAHELRKARNPHISQVPILLLTAYTARKWVEEARQTGIDAIVTKPVVPRTLWERSALAIKRRRDLVDAFMSGEFANESAEEVAL